MTNEEKTIHGIIMMVDLLEKYDNLRILLHGALGSIAIWNVMFKLPDNVMDIINKTKEDHDTLFKEIQDQAKELSDLVNDK